MKKLLISLFFAMLLASCTQTSNGVYSGFYTKWKDRDPITRVDNSINATKQGSACVTNVLGLVSTGDSSIETAKKAAGINKVAYVDRTFDNFYVFYQKGCTVVHGN